MLALGPGARVLEIGAGTGYNAALLAHLVGASGTVTSVELDPDAAADARRALRVAGSPVAVVVGDGHGGWPAAAPFDALVATASVDAIPLAWHEQLVPGGVLVVPLQLIRGMFLPQAVVALRRVRQGFDPVASSPGAFMRLRSDVAAAARGEGVTACEEVGDEPVERIRITGPALSALDGPARRRLLVTALGFTRSEAFPVRWPAAWDLLTYSAMALSEERLLAVERPPASPALGVLDAADGSLALLAAAKEGLRLESFGRTGAENALRSAADRWNLAGRPGVASARVTVRYGVARPHSWRSARRGDQWIGLDWGT
jgi:protein-L-isoaspartate(D-aspartate) O-methyltransferase